MAEFKTIIANEYGVEFYSISGRNHQANAIVERVRQTIGNILHTFKIQEVDLKDENPWKGILAFTMFVIQSTILC